LGLTVPSTFKAKKKKKKKKQKKKKKKKEYMRGSFEQAGKRFLGYG